MIMRKAILFTLSMLLLSQLSFAQIWLEIGPKATFGPSGFYNSVLANDVDHDYSLNLAFNYGGVIGLNIGDSHGFNFEVLTGTYFQDFTNRPAAGESVRNTVEWEVLDLYALYRYYAKSGMYAELGPKFTRINEFKQTIGVDPVATKGQYEEDYLSGVLGVGAFLSGSETMVFKMGLRLEYGFSDLVSVEGMENGYPSVTSNLNDQGDTTPFRVSFGMELSFGVGGVAQGICGRRGFVLGSRYGG
jgi:hypothetical protein